MRLQDLLPLHRRLPKHGFKNIFKVVYAVINLEQLLVAFEGKNEISLSDIYDRGLAKNGTPVKILGDGEVKSALSVEAHKFSVSAKEKIEKAGGAVKVLEG
jgi:large subunit ribosomal protein L15